MNSENSEENNIDENILENSLESDQQPDVIEEATEDGTENVDKKSQRRKAFFKEVLSWIYTIGAALILAYLLTNYVIINAVIPSGSMENTILKGDKLIANRLSYIFSEPERGDIVVFKYPDDETIPFIKRVIGLPGETVEIIDGVVYIDGEPLEDEYIKEPMDTSRGDKGPYLVPEDSYFMLGDNRNDSKDSREWINTYVEKDKILGKAVFRYYPRLTYLAK